MAKTYDNLFPELIRFDNLWQAYRKAARGKRRKAPVAAFEMDFADFKERVGGWIAHAAHGDTWGLRRSLLRQPLHPGGADQRRT